MEALEFSVPYNDDPNILEDIFKLNKTGGNIIREIFVPGPQEYSGSGRVASEITIDRLIDIIDKIHSESIKVNVVFNSICEGSQWYHPSVIDSTMDCLLQLHEGHGVETVTIANPLYIKETRKRFPEIEICASVLSEIDCVQKAIIYRKAGADAITPDVNINRNLSLLKQIRDVTGLELKLMVNEGCLYSCPFRMFHFNITSHASKEAGNKNNDYSFASFFNNCNQVTSRDHSQILKSCWIRPEDIRKYSEITSFFKIVGRSQSTSKVIRSIRAYMEENWDGDLLDLLCANIGNFSVNQGAYLNNKNLDRYNFFKKVTNCYHKCDNCQYCEDIARDLVELNVFTVEKSQDIMFSINSPH